MSNVKTGSTKPDIYRKMLKEIVQENPFSADDYYQTLFPPQVVIENTCAWSLCDQLRFSSI